MKIGVCTNIDNLQHIGGIGLDYLEVSVDEFLTPYEEEDAFTERLERARDYAIPIRAASRLFPGTLKCVGPQVDYGHLVDYARVAFYRAAQAGISIVVFGSGESRRAPEGFPPETAHQQLQDLLASLASHAATYNITIVLEPLCREACNLINTIEEAVGMISLVDAPNLRLMVDLYHLARENEDPTDLDIYAQYIHHAHVAEFAQRTCPGVAGESFHAYLDPLRMNEYYGGISIACTWRDFPAEVGTGTRVLREQLAEVGY